MGSCHRKSYRFVGGAVNGSSLSGCSVSAVGYRAEVMILVGLEILVAIVSATTCYRLHLS
jgi:hypothetical protein